MAESDQQSSVCVFCKMPAERIRGENDYGFWIRDGFPISPGHSLVIPRRHFMSFFDASANERSALFDLLDAAKAAADLEFAPNGFNVGVNDGLAAGQTVHHLHIHLIPRFFGDVPDPRGGVRWVVPDKADYWSRR